MNEFKVTIDTFDGSIESDKQQSAAGFNEFRYECFWINISYLNQMENLHFPNLYRVFQRTCDSD